MENLLSRLARNPYAPIDGASVTRVDELGNGSDDWGNLIAPKYTAPEQTWGETALGVATAPARLATALAGSLSPYGADGWQVPPIMSEGADALTAVGDAYSGKMAPEEIPSRALGMAGFMMGGGGPALALERSLPQASVSLGDMVMAKYLDWKHPDARSTRNVLQNNADYLNELKRRPKGVDGSYDSDTLERIRMWEDKVYGQPLTPYRSRFQDAIQQMNKTLQNDIDRMETGGETAFNDFIDDLPRLTPDDTGYMNALLQTRKPEFDVIYGATKASDDARYNDLVRRSFERFGKHYESLNPEQTRVIRDGVTNRSSFDVIDGGLFSNSDSRPALLAGAGQEQDIPDWLLPFLGK